MKKAYYLVGEDKEENVISWVFFAETPDAAEKAALAEGYSSVFQMDDITNELHWETMEIKVGNVTHFERHAHVGNAWYPESMAL